MKVYVIVHHYGVDGGYGDYIPEEETIAIVSSKEEAIRWCKKHENPHVYDIPYAELDCGMLSVQEVEVVDHLDDIDDPNWEPWHSNVDSVECDEVYCSEFKDKDSGDKN